MDQAHRFRLRPQRQTNTNLRILKLSFFLSTHTFRFHFISILIAPLKYYFTRSFCSADGGTVSGSLSKWYFIRSSKFSPKLIANQSSSTVSAATPTRHPFERR